MKKYVFVLLTIAFTNICTAQGILGKVKQAAGKDSSRVERLLKTKVGNTAIISNDEIIAGLKQALTIGADSAAKKLHAADGFFKNSALKILMPDEAKKAESTLRKFGMGSLVDKAILGMNRAAEDAAGGIAPIFWDAIKKMNISDGVSILRGVNFAATDYLKQQTTASLVQQMKPVVDAALAKVNATNYWRDVFTAYNKLSNQPVNTDLSGYVTEKAMAGIFYAIGQEEQKIRENPGAQVTNLLKKVFAK